jgi:hypothetical protein
MQQAVDKLNLRPQSLKALYLLYMKPGPIKVIKEMLKKLRIDMRYVIAVDYVGTMTYEVVLVEEAAADIKKLLDGFGIKTTFTFDRLKPSPIAPPRVKKKQTAYLVKLMAQAIRWATTNSRNLALREFREQQMKQAGQETLDMVLARLEALNMKSTQMAMVPTLDESFTLPEAATFAPSVPTTMLDEYVTAGSGDSDMMDHQTHLLSEMYNEIRIEHENDSIEPLLSTMRVGSVAGVPDVHLQALRSLPFANLLPPPPPLTPQP